MREFRRESVLKSEAGQDYGLVKKIGQGSYGKVHLAVLLDFINGSHQVRNKHPVVIKIVKDLDQFQRESDVLTQTT